MDAANKCRRRIDALVRHLWDDNPSSDFEHMIEMQICQYNSSPSIGEHPPVVIGSMVLDIHATPSSDELRRGTTTPGKVRYVRGGVGRNIAECMSKLGVKPFFISVVGKDMAGDALLENLNSLGISTNGIRQCSEGGTPVVSAIFDGTGELAGAVVDTDIVEKYLTPEWICQFERQIQQASFLLLDANLSPAALEAACNLAELSDLHIWFEPVSVSKSVRYSTISHHLMCVSPNEAELVAMATGGHSRSSNSLKQDHSVHSMMQYLQQYISSLLEKEIKFIILTLGEHGVVLCAKSHHVDAEMRTANRANLPWSSLPQKQFSLHQSSGISYVHFPALPASIVSLSGAGDCLVAGVITALSLRLGLIASIAFGVAVARQAIQSELNVPTEMSHADLKDDTERVLASTMQLHLSN